MFKIYDISKILHWVFVPVLLAVVFTAIMNTTFFSKEAIMESFKFSFPNVDLYEVGAADQLFIARMERRVGWVFHFWSGCVLFSIIIGRYLSCKNKTLFQYLVYSTIFAMFLTGMPLFIRVDIDIPMYIQDLARNIHFYFAWFFGLVCVSHIFAVIYRENKFKENKISKHFHFKKYSFLIAIGFAAALNQPLQAGEKISHYELGMKYYKGEIGGVTISKIMPNCPYDACKKAQMMKKKFKIKEVDGNDVMFIKKRDLKTALFFLEKSAFLDNDKKGADKALKMLLGNLNYKDKTPEDFLVKNLMQEFEVTLDEYKIKVKKLLSSSQKIESCYGSFKYAQFIEEGYLNLFQTDKEKLLGAYQSAYDSCPGTRMEKMMANSKIKQLKKGEK